MAPITTGNNPRMQFPGIKTIFDNTSQKYAPIWSEAFKTESSEKGQEIDVEHTQFGYARFKGQGVAIENDSDRQGYTITTQMKTAALGYEITMEEIQDNLYAKVGRARAEGLAFSLDQFKELNAANVFNRAENSAYNLGDTGVPLISASHPSRGAGLQSNVVNGSLSHAVLYDAFTRAGNMEDARGLKIRGKPTKLFIRPENRERAEIILESKQRSGTADNDLNYFQAGSRAVKIVENPWFDTVGMWFIENEINPSGRAVHYQRWRRVFEKDNQFTTKGEAHNAYERYAFAMRNWRQWFGRVAL